MTSVERRGPGAWARTILLLMAQTLLTHGADPAPGESGFTFFEPVRPPRSQQVMVPGGLPQLAPASTQAALDLAIEEGVEWVRSEVHQTRDGHAVLAPADRLVDWDGREWVISRSTWPELREVDFGSAVARRFEGTRLLTLPEALAQARGRLNLCLDDHCRDRDVVTVAVHMAGIARQVLVSRPEDLPGRPPRPGERRALHRDRIAKLAQLVPWTANLEALSRGPEGRFDPAPLIAWARSNQVAAVELAPDRLLPDLVTNLHAAGLKTLASSPPAEDATEFWKRARAARVDWVQTRTPEEFLAQSLWARLAKPPVRFSLHRGAGRYAPENTLPAFEKAIRLGADFVEFDLRTTRDGEVFLLHDGKLDRTTDGTGSISEATAEAVRKLSAGVKFSRALAPVRVPSFDDFLRAVGQRVELYVDAKAIAPEVLVATLERHGVLDRAVVYQQPEYLRRLKTLAPRLRRMPPLRALADLDALAKNVEPFSVDVDWSILSADLVARCHALGIQVFSDALDEHDRVEDHLKAITWGLDVIQTDEPMQWIRALELKLERSH